MTWTVAILTWNAPAALTRTLTALTARLTGEYGVLVLDNGSDDPAMVARVVADVCPVAMVLRSPVNLGAGGGMSELMRSVNTDFCIYTEDDWTIGAALCVHDLEPILADRTIGQVRLRARPPEAAGRAWGYGLQGLEAEASIVQALEAPRLPWGGGYYQAVKLLWTCNPSAFRRDVIPRFLLTGQTEYPMSIPYLRSELFTASTIPGYFVHQGEIRQRRGEAGWRA